MAEVNSALLKRIAELIDGDQWELADLLVDEFPPELYGDAENKGTNTGLYDELEDYSHELILQYGIERKASTLRNVRATGLAWPRALRSARAPFDVHKMLRGPNRLNDMNRYLRKNQDRPLTSRTVARYRAADKGTKPPMPWALTAERRIHSTVKSLLLRGGIITKRKDWWNTDGTSESARVLAAILHDLATKLEEGT